MGIRITAVAAAVLLSVTGASQAQQGDLRILARHQTSRQFQQRTVECGAELSLLGGTGSGARATLHVDIRSDLAGHLPDEDARLGAINGIIAVALPSGLEFTEEPRLFFLHPESGNYEYMYSDSIEQKPWLPDISQALADASSNRPDQIYQGISRLNAVLDARVQTVLPADNRILGTDPDYSVAGKSWIVPCNMMFTDLVDMFEPRQSLVKLSNLRLSIPIRVAGSYDGAEIVVYTGFLSTAVARVTMLPQNIPPDLIILVDQDSQPSSEPPAEVQAEPVEPEPGDEDRIIDDDDVNAAAAAAGNAEDPAPGLEPEPEPQEPQPVDAQVYSYEWYSWETSVSLLDSADITTDVIPGQEELPAAEAQPRPAMQEQSPADAAGSGAAVPVGPSAGGTELPPAGGDEPVQAIPAEHDSPEDSPSAPEVQVTAADESGDSVNVLATADGGRSGPADPGHGESVPRVVVQDPAPAQADPEPAEQPATDSGTAAGDRNAGGDNAEEQARAGEPEVVEITPGTLPVEVDFHVVPLKPITAGNSPGVQAQSGGPAIPSGMPGTAPGMSPQVPGISAGQFVPPADLGEMLLVPEGYFLMGTSNTASAGDADELPQSQVYVPAFYIDKHLVTNRQFYAYVVSSGYKPGGNWDKYYDQGTADMPVRGVTWEDANAYARWAGKRLPTEAEWEKACRGTDGRLYPWGDEWSSEILPRGDYVFNLVHAPGALSPFGVQSMVGVLWQWTSSSYAMYPYNPDAMADEKVLRGGCYSNGRNIIRCANRYAEPSNVALNTFGFRCARDA